MIEYLSKLHQIHRGDRNPATKEDVGRSDPTPLQIVRYIAEQNLTEMTEELVDQYPPTEDTLITKNQGL